MNRVVIKTLMYVDEKTIIVIWRKLSTLLHPCKKFKKIRPHIIHCPENENIVQKED